jgi:hypothetical protein
MGQAMPHHLEKGQLFSAIENLYNTPPLPEGEFSGLNAARCLARKRIMMINEMEKRSSERAVVGSQFENSLKQSFGLPTETDLPYSPLFANRALYDEAIEHIQNHWFSRKKKNSHGRELWSRSPLPVDEDPFKALPEWTNYWGDVEGIIFHTLLTALYQSIGLTRRIPATNHGLEYNPEYVWPIEIVHICGPAWFEGWVSWSDTSRWGAWDQPVGHVQVVLITPNNAVHGGANPSIDPSLRRGYPAVSRRGMAVVTYPEHVAYAQGTSFPQPLTGAVNGPPVIVGPSTEGAVQRTWTNEEVLAALGLNPLGAEASKLVAAAQNFVASLDPQPSDLFAISSRNIYGVTPEGGE